MLNKPLNPKRFDRLTEIELRNGDLLLKTVREVGLLPVDGIRSLRNVILKVIMLIKQSVGVNGALGLRLKWLQLMVASASAVVKHSLSFSRSIISMVMGRSIGDPFLVTRVQEGFTFTFGSRSKVGLRKITTSNASTATVLMDSLDTALMNVRERQQWYQILVKFTQRFNLTTSWFTCPAKSFNWRYLWLAQ